MQPDFLINLIDVASKAAGNNAKLAKSLQVTPSTVSQWRHGKKTCPAGDVALMAELAGLDAEAWLARATVAQYAGTTKGEKLAVVLGKALLATGAAVAGSGANAAQAMGEGCSYLIRCIVLLSKRKPLAYAF